MAELDPLRCRLIPLRAALVGQLAAADAVEPGLMALIAGLNNTLLALDAEPVIAEPAERAVVSDDGQEIRLTIYTQANPVAAVILDPVRAVGLCAKLIAAALPKLKAP